MFPSRSSVSKGVTKEWVIVDNHIDVLAKMSDGHALSIDLFWRFKSHKYYTELDSRVSKAFGSDAWLESLGPNMTAKRKAAVEAVALKEEELADAMKESLADGTPTKKVLLNKRRIR